jgi:UDP-N-acetylmuramoyl-tripeptide--D-alanyl-D-alanine ligase
MKNVGKKIVLRVLSWQLKRLYQRWHPKVVVVVGSYGKTSTKFAIATVLKEHFRVRFQKGNYNDIVTVPLVFFDEELPSLYDPLAWILLFLRNERQLRRPAPYDVLVLELGTDGPGQIEQFGRYLHADLAVVTAVAYEHMEFFKDIDAVGQEETAVQQFSDRLLVNTELCADRHLWYVKRPVNTYAFAAKATYKLGQIRASGERFSFTIAKGSKRLLSSECEGVARVQLYSAAAAVGVADMLGVRPFQIEQGLRNIRPVAGRMQRLKGIRGSTIIDETYNASPEAVKAALDTLYLLKAPQKIALLGNMNELGDYAADAHTAIGQYCEPEQLDVVITLGPDANEYLALAAHNRGCHVVTFADPYEAGEYLRDHIKPGAAVLIKGSQNRVFAEEAIKPILADPADARLLVRQSKAWRTKKHKSFGRHERAHLAP